MPTDYQGLSPEILEAFESAYPRGEDSEVQAEVDALEALFGRPMPAELGQLIQLDRDPVLAPTPTQLVAMEHPFEALILRAQELDDCVSVLFPLTGSVYMTRFRGLDLLGHVGGKLDRPVMPFAGWRRDKWAYDLPSVLQIAMALRAFDDRDYEEVERLLTPVWGRIQPTEYTEQMFYALEDCGATERLNEAWADRPNLRPSLRQWWRHERALFFGFALMGKFREPEKDAFANDPDKGLASEHLTTSLGLQMSLLWRGWFLPEGDLLERAMAATESSTSLLVQDARRLIAELQDGRRTVGTADLIEARETYKSWVDDPAAYGVVKRSRQRIGLEQRLAPSEHGIEMVRASWPLEAEVRTEPDANAPTHTWDPHTRELTATRAGQTTQHALPEPPSDSKIYLARGTPPTCLSESGRRFFCTATIHQKTQDGRSWENAPMLVEHDLDTGVWRPLVDAKKLQWCASIDDGRWVIRDGEDITLLRDLGSEFGAKFTGFSGQPRTFHLPELGVVIAYGSTDLVLGRNPDDRKAPWIRVFAYWSERLACIAAFPVDGVELVAEQVDGKWTVGLVAEDREVAWELRGLQEGVDAWRAASRADEKEERAKRKAFGEITVDRAVEALNTFVGTEYGPEYQEGLDAAFSEVLAALREDSDAVAAAKSASTALEFSATIKAPLSKALTNSGRGSEFLDFALKCTILRPTYADVVVRAAASSAWQALRLHES